MNKLANALTEGLNKLANPPALDKMAANMRFGNNKSGFHFVSPSAPAPQRVRTPSTFRAAAGATGRALKSGAKTVGSYAGTALKGTALTGGLLAGGAIGAGLLGAHVLRSGAIAASRRRRREDE